MSEQSVGVEAMSPQARATAYLEMKQAGRLQGLVKDKDIKTPMVPEKVKRVTPLIESVTAYEQMIDTMGEKGYVGAQQALERLRPDAYTGLKAFQWGARAADYATTALLFFAPDFLSDKLPVSKDILAKPAKKWFGKWGTMIPAVPAKTASLGGGTADALVRNDLGRGLTILGMWRFRPLEFIGAKAVQLGGKVLTSDMVAPIVNNILGGGERVQPAAAPKPMAA